jgi:hypothetical protein
MARKVYRVVPNGSQWRVTHDGGILSNHVTKEGAVSAGRVVAKANRPSQLMVHKADGTFEYEYTYDGDPYPPRG